MESSTFGKSARKHFAFDTDYINLNHGSFGAVPIQVLEAYRGIAAQIEARPDKFMRVEWGSHLHRAREAIASFIGAPTEDCVFVSNVSTGVQTVLQNIHWQPGDVLVLFSTTFEAVVRGARNRLRTSSHPQISDFVVHFPVSHKDILQDFRRHLQSVKGSLAPTTAKYNPKVVVILDSIVSFPGVMLPWRQMVGLCKEEGAISIVDAAHSAGQEPDLSVGEVSPDYWISSCNKWLCSKRACAVLYVPKRNQPFMHTSIPTDLLAEEDADFCSRFVWFGASDAATILTVPAAIEFRQSLGGEKPIYEYCHNLAVAGGRRLAEYLQTTVMESGEGDELTACMVNVELPLSALEYSSKAMLQIHTKLLTENNVYGAPFYHNDRWWVRACAHVYNEISDFEKLGVALKAICGEMTSVKMNNTDV